MGAIFDSPLPDVARKGCFPGPKRPERVGFDSLSHDRQRWNSGGLAATSRNIHAPSGLASTPRPGFMSTARCALLTAKD